MILLRPTVCHQLGLCCCLACVHALSALCRPAQAAKLVYTYDVYWELSGHHLGQPLGRLPAHARRPRVHWCSLLWRAHWLVVVTQLFSSVAMVS